MSSNSVSNNRITSFEEVSECKRCNLIIENVPTPLIVWDRYNRIQKVNQATKDLVNQFHTVYPHTLSTGVGDKCPWLAPELEKFIEQNIDQFVVKKDLGIEPDNLQFEIKFIRLTDEHNKYCGNAAMFKDVTDLARKEVEQALRESEERYRRLVELSPDPIGVHCQGNFVYTNQAMLQILGAETEAEILGQPVLNFMHPDYREIVEKRMRSVLEGHVGPMMEERIVRLDGKVVDVEIMATPFKYRGQPAVQVVGHDITERKQLQEEYLKSTKLESLGILAGGIAHDFNNILTIILGNISLARAGMQPGDKIHTRLQEVEKAAFEAISLTQQLLTFAKGGEPIKKPVSIAELIVEATSFALRGSSVRYEQDIAEDLWAVEVDEGQIKQVINNLMINAQQAMPTGGTVLIRAENINMPRPTKRQPFPVKGEYVKISIQDQGVGISADKLPKIFDPYFTTKRNGNGLGLATAYSIINKHNGFLTVESQEGVGTTFYIYLARTQEQVHPQNREAQTLLKGKGHVLVIDDEEKILRVAAEMLEYLGYDYRTASDGLEGIELYKQKLFSPQAFDAVIMDLTIPGGMGGKEAIREFSRLDPNIRAIVSSGYSEDPVMADYDHYGFKSCMSKPYRIEELGRVLNQVLHGNLEEHNEIS